MCVCECVQACGHLFHNYKVTPLTRLYPPSKMQMQEWTCKAHSHAIFFTSVVGKKTYHFERLNVMCTITKVAVGPASVCDLN